MEQNIEVLNEVLDLNLVSVDRERKTESSFSVDLVAEDESGITVVVENQLGKSDHDHLGKLITYLAATEARAAIWVVSEPRPEHVSAVGWLNDAGLARFYLVKVEAVQIGDSPPAPLLTLIVEPSDEVALIRGTTSEQSERHRLRQVWWGKLISHPEARLHSHISPGGYSYIGTSAGVRGLSLNYVIKQDFCAAELYIDRGKGSDVLNHMIFEELAARRTEIESAFGGELSWEALEAKRACRIKAPLTGGYRADAAEWDGIQQRQIDAMNRLQSSLKPHIDAIDIASLEQATFGESDETT